MVCVWGVKKFPSMGFAPFDEILNSPCRVGSVSHTSEKRFSENWYAILLSPAVALPASWKKYLEQLPTSLVIPSALRETDTIFRRTHYKPPFFLSCSFFIRLVLDSLVRLPHGSSMGYPERWLFVWSWNVNFFLLLLFFNAVCASLNTMKFLDICAHV